MNCQGLNPSVWQLSPQPHIHPDVLGVGGFFFHAFGCSQSRPSHIDRRDPPIRLGTMGDEGRGFAKSGQLHPPFFRLLSTTIIDKLPKRSSFCLSFFIYLFIYFHLSFFVVFYFCFDWLKKLRVWVGWKCITWTRLVLFDQELQKLIKESNTLNSNIYLSPCMVLHDSDWANWILP